MKGDIACLPGSGYMRVTRSEFTKYRCSTDYEFCKQVEVTPVIRSEVTEGKTVYWVDDSTWWVKSVAE